MNTPATEPITSAFDLLPREQKIAVFEDILCSLSSELCQLGDPVLNRELDLLDSIHSNIANRIEEIEKIYGMK